MASERREDEQPEVEMYRCPIHGEVEGLVHMDGPLSTAFPTPVLCEECDPFQITVVGYDEEEMRGG